MSSLIPDLVRRILSAYTFEIDYTATNDDLTCLVCKKIMIDAYQTQCGCQYCHDCIVKYLSEGEKYCCGGKRDCKEDLLVLEINVGRSMFLNRKILRLKVICPNESCTHSAELREMEKHLRVCTKQSIECPYSSLGCDNERAAKDTILTHLHDNPLMHTQLLIEYIHGLKNEFEQLKDNFAMRELEITTLKEEWMGQMNEQKKDIECLKKGSKAKEIQIVELINEVTTLKNEIKLVRDESRNIKNTVATLDGQSKKYEGETVAMKTVVREERVERERRENDGWRRVDGLEATIDGMNMRMNAMSAVGTMVLTVDRFSARKNTTEYIGSPYFYSHRNGYILRLKVFPGGNGDGRRTHLSVFNVICKGEYDDQLPWPCKHNFTWSIVNQRNKETHNTEIISHSATTDDCKHYYNKPTKTDNIGEGNHKFISHEDLRSIVGLIVDDCVVIKCVVTAPP